MHISNINIVKTATELIKIAKLFVAKAVTIDRSVVDYIWNSIKNKPISNDKNDYNDNYNKTLILSKQILQSLFECEFDLQPLYIIILKNSDLNKLKNKKISLFNPALKFKQNHKDYSGFYSEAYNMIYIFYGATKEDGISKLQDNLFGFQGYKKEIIQHLRHELIHYYKINILGLNQEASNSNDFNEYINSDIEYDSWIDSISEIIVNKIKDIDVEHNKIQQIYLENNKSTGIKFDYYVKKFLQINEQEKYNDFFKKGEKDILKAIEQKILYKYNAKKVYENIEQAKKDIKNNYFFLYKAVNKNIIKNDDTIIIDIVKYLLKNKKIHSIKILFQNNKLINFMNEIKKLFESYKYKNEKIYFKLINYGLVQPTVEYIIKTTNNFEDLVELYLQQDNNDIKLKILDEAFNKFNMRIKKLFFDSLNDELKINNIQDQLFKNFCEQKNIKFPEEDEFNYDF